jgi:hypothetical protein
VDPRRRHRRLVDLERSAAVPAEAGKLRVDKLVKVRRLDGAEEWVPIHLEVQSQPDAQLSQRAYRQS